MVKKNQTAVIDEVIEALTNSSKIAASFGDRLLSYLIEMAVFHANRIKINGKLIPKERQRGA